MVLLARVVFGAAEGLDLLAGVLPGVELLEEMGHAELGVGVGDVFYGAELFWEVGVVGLFP